MANAISNSPNTKAEQAASAQPSSTALAIAGGDFRIALEPGSFKDTLEACDLVSQAQLSGCESPAIVLAKVMAGRALGLGFMQSVMGIHNIKGTLSVSAKTKVALCLQSSLCEYFRCIETTEVNAVYETRRVGQDARRLEYTIEEAERSKLLDRGSTAAKAEMNNWNRFPAAMLRARASSTLADIVYGDLLQGMPSTEEMRDVDPREMVGEVVRSAPPSNATARDFASESRALTAKIETITPETLPAARKAIRDEIAAWDAPEAYRRPVLESYNDSPKYVRKGGMPEPQNAPPPAPPVDAKPAREPGVD